MNELRQRPISDTMKETLGFPEISDEFAANVYTVVQNCFRLLGSITTKVIEQANWKYTHPAQGDVLRTTKIEERVTKGTITILILIIRNQRMFVKTL